jgi:acyl-CoA hydrolase
MNSELYRSKVASVEDVMKKVLSGDKTVVLGMAAMEPQSFLNNLKNCEFKNLRVFSCLDVVDFPVQKDPKFSGKFLNESWFYSNPTREAAGMGIGTVTYIPNNLHLAGADKIQNDKPDVYWGIASPMDKHGYLTLSLSVVYEKEMIENVDKIVLEVNPNAPRTHGDTQIHISEVDHIIEVDYPIPTIVNATPTKEDELIAGYIADLIEDGSTIQLGIGGIPNAVSSFLANKHDLGIHTEMLTQGMVELLNKGVITNRKKTLWPGKMICTFGLGEKSMYDFVDDNPGILFLRGKYVNDPYVIAQNEKMVSINTALMVDLTGQVASESIGFKHYSGTGGQLDTHRGASMARNGKGIIALHSTAKDGKISKIVPFLPEGTGVTVPRQDVDWVVTEYGAIHLKGKSVRERAKLLISIADPAFKEELKKFALSNHIL